jgi:DNA-directed RNA polymerase alpha subunit
MNPWDNTPENPHATPIERLNLHVHTYNCLRRADIRFVQQLLALRCHDVLALRTIKEEDLAEIQAQLRAAGFPLLAP